MLSVRSASLRGFVPLAQSLQLDAHKLLRSVGLSVRSLEDPETPISAQAVSDLLETCAKLSGVEDFALRLAADRNLSNLGPLSLILREASTARDALDTLCRYLRLLNASLITRVEEAGDRVIIREDIMVHPSVSLRQSVEMALGVMHRILRGLLGPEWHPLHVHFTHRQPAQILAHQQFFHCPVLFNQDFNGIVCAKSDLDATLAQSDPVMTHFARRYLEQALSHQHEDPVHTVRQLITALLPGGRCTADQVAQHLGVDRRTVNRHLAKHQTSFSAVLNEVRADLATRHIVDSDMPTRELASLLGFSSPSVFCHWFRQQFDASPTDWRLQQRSTVA